MSYLSAAHNRFVAFASERPNEIQLFPTPEDFTERKQHAHELVRQLGEYLTSLAIDTEGSTSAKLNPGELIGRFTDALEESDFYCGLDDAAERCREDRLEAAE